MEKNLREIKIILRKCKTRLKKSISIYVKLNK